jgi:hypothetical protein
VLQVEHRSPFHNITDFTNVAVRVILVAVDLPVIAQVTVSAITEGRDFLIVAQW